MPAVEFVQVHKRYGDKHIVKGVSLSVGAGEFLVLVGPSGCGKSTCLRMIAGLEEITEGELRIDDRRVNELSPRDRDIGMVFQSYALYPHMTVRQNIAFGLTLRKTPKEEIESRVNDAAKMLELEPLMDRRPKDLSGGQRQRVAIGRAIVRRPRVFLFDEPLSNLDAALRVQMRAEILALHRRVGSTMVYVTHDQVEAMTLATRIAVLNDGILQQVGPPHELFHRPANRFVAGFIGSPAMNFVEGKVVALGGQLLFEGSGLRVALPGEVAPSLKDGAAVTLGIRPNDVEVGTGQLQGGVQVVEAMGWEAYIHVTTAAGRFVVRVEGERAQTTRTGDRVMLGISPSEMHLFDADGKAVLAPAPRQETRASA